MHACSSSFSWVEFLHHLPPNHSSATSDLLPSLEGLEKALLVGATASLAAWDFGPHSPLAVFAHTEGYMRLQKTQQISEERGQESSVGTDTHSVRNLLFSAAAKEGTEEPEEMEDVTFRHSVLPRRGIGRSRTW